MKLSVFGLGYVGAVSTACLAKLGHEVIGVDVNPDKVAAVAAGRSPVVEPEVGELLAAARAAGRLAATSDPQAAVAASDASFVCVGTPSARDGSVEPTFLERVLDDIARACLRKGRYHGLLVRSTALPGVHAALCERLERHGLSLDRDLAYVVHPEFLREGSAVADFLAPPKIVFGGADARAREWLASLYPGVAAPTFYASREVAAIVKYADNAFHALKVTFANEIGQIAKSLGGDSHAVMDIFSADTVLNLSPYYLKPGLPFGGSCLPKDVRALLRHGTRHGLDTPLLGAVLQSNARQLDRLVDELLAIDARRFLLVGLAFKGDTDDVRESPMLLLAERLLGRGKTLAIYEPNLLPERLIGQNRRFALESIPHLMELLVADFPAAAAGADVIVLGARLTPEHRAVVAQSPATVFDFVRAFPAPPGGPGRYVGLYW